MLYSERSGGGITSYTVNQSQDDDENDSKIKSLESQIREQEVSNLAQFFINRRMKFCSVLHTFND